MGEFYKVLIEFAKGRRWLREFLVVAALLGALGSAYLYLGQHQEAMSLVKNAAARAIGLLVIGSWISTVLWRISAPKPEESPALPELAADPAAPVQVVKNTASRENRLKAFSAIVMLATTASSSYLYLSSRFEPIRVHVVFDYGVSAGELGKIAEALNSSKLLEVELDDRAVSGPRHGRNGSLTLQDARALLEGIGKMRRANEAGAVPVYVTRGVLSDDHWNRLLLITAPDLIVISGSFLNGPDQTISTEFGRRYVASSVALEAVHAEAKRRGRVIIDRPPGTYRGCMFDFFEQVDDYIQRTQNPKLCPMESEAVENVFGASTREALVTTLKRIAEMH